MLDSGLTPACGEAVMDSKIILLGDGVVTNIGDGVLGPIF